MRLSTLASALAFLAIPTLASAHAGNNDPEMVHACIGNVSRVVRVVGVGGSCIASPHVLAETPAHWPQVKGMGLQGPKGDQGPQGLPGPQGEPGTNGTNGRDATEGARRPDGPCFDMTSGRYMDCGNGTVTDTFTGLIWLKQANCLPNANWVDANAAAAALKHGDCGLTDGSSPGDWRLPTGAEWSATLAKAIALGCTVANGTAPTLTDTAGFQCASSGGTIFVGVQPIVYMSSNTYVDHTGLAVTAFLNGGGVGALAKSSGLGVWPVRSGAR